MGGRTHWAPGAVLAVLGLLVGATARAQASLPAEAGAPALAAAVAPAPASPAASAGMVAGAAEAASQSTLPRSGLAPVSGTLDAMAPAAQLPKNRVRNYVHDLTGVGAILGVVGGAAIDQMSDTPAQWGKGFSGYADRLASHAGALVVGETVHHGLAYEMNETTRYELCGCRDFSLQAEHAFVGAVTDRDLATGRRVVSVPRIAGAFAGSFAPTIWQPGYSAGNALVGGALTLVASGAFNLVDELLHTPRYHATAQTSP